MKVSVALGTFNGGEYVEPQLDSILGQTRPPDEIVVCDDGSTDGTRRLLREYADEFPDVFDLHFNEENLGIVKNFERCIRRCTGRYIALSDQDDVWRADKLERQLRAIRNNDVGLVFHNASIVTESLTRSGDFWSSRSYEAGTARETNRGFEELVRRNYAQGATMLFDAGMRDEVLPIPRRWQHDYYISVIAGLVGGLYDIDAELLRYRQHGDQNVGDENSSIRRRAKAGLGREYEEYTRYADKWKRLSKRVAEMDPEATVVDREAALESIDRCYRYERNRAVAYDDRLPFRERVRGFGRNLRNGAYLYYGGPLHVLMDGTASVSPALSSTIGNHL